MIEFSCDNCGRKIGVKDQLAGKRGKCPGCHGPVVVPEKTILVTFKCDNCGEGISAPAARAGREGKCPRCRHALIIPAGHDLTLLDVGVEYKIKDQPPDQPVASQVVMAQAQEEEPANEQDEPQTNPDAPWFVHVLLYPTSSSGLIHLGIFTLLPLVITIFDSLQHPLRMHYNRGIGAVGLLATIAFSLYICWYLTECVRDSAQGGTRAPVAFATANLGEMWSQAQHIIGCYLVFAGPVGFYYLFTRRTDAVFWALMSYGVFFLPMGLLACIMFDSVSGLNPILLIGSILSTVVQYSCLVGLVAGIILILGVVTRMARMARNSPPGATSYWARSCTPSFCMHRWWWRICSDASIAGIRKGLTGKCEDHCCENTRRRSAVGRRMQVALDR